MLSTPEMSLDSALPISAFISDACNAPTDFPENPLADLGERAHDRSACGFLVSSSLKALGHFGEVHLSLGPETNPHPLPTLLRKEQGNLHALDRTGVADQILEGITANPRPLQEI